MPSIFRTKWATVGLVALIGFFGLRLIQASDQYHQEAQRSADAQAKLALVQQEHDRLQQRLDQAHDDAYLEQQARVKLNYQFPDEQVAFIDDGVAPTATVSDSSSVPRDGILARVRAWLYATLDDLTGKPK